MGTGVGAASLEDYLRQQDIRMVRLSPDGAKIALIAHSGAEAQIRVVGADDHALLYSQKLGGAVVADLGWISNDALMTVTETTSRPWGLEGDDRQNYLAAAIDIKTGTVLPLLGNGRGNLDTVLGTPVVVRGEGTPQIYMQGVFFPDRFGVRALFRTSLDWRRVDRLEDGVPTTTGFFVNPKGEPAARTDYDQKTQTWRLWAKRGLAWRVIHTESAKSEPPRVLGLDGDGRSLLVRLREDGGFKVRRAGLEDGSWSEPLPGFEGGEPLLDPKSRLVIGMVRRGALKATLRFFAPDDQTTWDMVLHAFPGENVTPVSWSDNRSRLVVLVSGEKTGEAFFLIDARKGKADWLADAYLNLGPGAFAERHLIRYQGAGGAEIAAVLTAPREGPRTGLPLVVIPHAEIGGGDLGVGTELAQALAAEGYLVLQPEARPIRDSGEALGPRLESDLESGVAFLTRSGEADGSRACILGFRYGGYAALAGATLNAGAWRCAVAVEGVSDLKSYLGYLEERSRHEAVRQERSWRRVAGADSIADPRLEALSPLAHAGEAKAPILLIHPKSSVVIPYAQSAQMAAALKAAGKPFDLVPLSADDTFLESETSRMAALKAAVSFIESRDPPAPRAPARNGP
jgi:dipeptidyl aminopeptidase/acylaminoacyl peptidase